MTLKISWKLKPNKLTPEEVKHLIREAGFELNLQKPASPRKRLDI
jgi:hypothetical protein